MLKEKIEMSEPSELEIDQSDFLLAKMFWPAPLPLVENIECVQLERPALDLLMLVSSLPDTPIVWESHRVWAPRPVCPQLHHHRQNWRLLAQQQE